MTAASPPPTRVLWAFDSHSMARKTAQKWVDGSVQAVVTGTIAAQGFDLLVMGAYSHSPLRKLLMGSKTSDLLQAVQIPTLLLR